MESFEHIFCDNIPCDSVTNPLIHVQTLFSSLFINLLLFLAKMMKKGAQINFTVFKEKKNHHQECLFNFYASKNKRKEKFEVKRLSFLSVLSFLIDDNSLLVVEIAFFLSTFRGFLLH